MIVTYHTTNIFAAGYIGSIINITDWTRINTGDAANTVRSYIAITIFTMCNTGIISIIYNTVAINTGNTAKAVCSILISGNCAVCRNIFYIAIVNTGNTACRSKDFTIQISGRSTASGIASYYRIWSCYIFNITSIITGNTTCCTYMLRYLAAVFINK